MGRLSLRAKLTLGATVLAALAVALGLFVLLTTLRSSLIAQVDAELDRHSTNIVVGIEDLGGEPDIALLPADFDTLAVIYDLDLQPVVSNIDEFDPVTDDELLTEAMGSDGELTAEYLTEIEGYTLNLPGDFAETRTLGLLETFDGQYLVLVAQSLRTVNDTVGTVRRWSLIAGPLLVALIAGLVWALTGRTLRRVDTMRSQVDEITATADLSRRVEQPAGGDEISRLATTMNQMLERLQTNDLRQRRFMSDAAHELRSPLASMAAQIDVELAHPDHADWPATGVAVRKDASRLERIIDDLLGLARIEGGATTLNARPESVDLGDLAIEQAHVAAAGSAGRHIDLDLSQVQSVDVTGARSQIERVLVNLLSNAFRHASSRVAVATSANGEMATIEVTDDGSGIPAGDRRVIFDRFVRLDEARSRDQGGSGLGLALVREIVDAHGGSIEVGEGPDGGARFTVTLPRSAAPPAG